jgi:hypothetical protein
MSGIEMIAAERQRQIDVEGYTSKHDDKHMDAELAEAGCAYADMAAMQLGGLGDRAIKRVPDVFPWTVEWWKPSTDPVRKLVKAGALIAAEIDRLQRAKQCCERDNNGDGNCYIHSAPGVLRNKAMQPEEKP